MKEKLKPILKLCTKVLGIIMVGIGLCCVVDLVLAQTTPGANPPPPIHTGGEDQSKIGDLEISLGDIRTIVGNIEANLGYVKGEELCIGSDCRDAWSEGRTLECVEETTTKLTSPGEDVIVNCPSGYTVTGGGFSVSGLYATWGKNHPQGNGWVCNRSGGAGILVVCSAICCKLQ